MNPDRQFLQNLYEAFNNREIETIVSLMHPNVKWANGMEGGFVYGRDRVHDYWKKQFEIMQPKLQTLNFETDEADRSVVTVRQIVRDLEGNLLFEKTVRQIFTFKNGLIRIFEIGDAEPILNNKNL